MAKGSAKGRYVCKVGFYDVVNAVRLSSTLAPAAACAVQGRWLRGSSPR
jgi:hypothetical protein